MIVARHNSGGHASRKGSQAAHRRGQTFPIQNGEMESMHRDRKSLVLRLGVSKVDAGGHGALISKRDSDVIFPKKSYRSSFLKRRTICLRQEECRL